MIYYTPTDDINSQKQCQKYNMINKIKCGVISRYMKFRRMTEQQLTQGQESQMIFDEGDVLNHFHYIAVVLHNFIARRSTQHAILDRSKDVIVGRLGSGTSSTRGH